MTDSTEGATTRDAVFAFFRTKGQVGGTTESERLAFDYIDGALLDSFGIVEMVTEFESQFGIAFSTEDLQSPRFRTIGGLIDIIEHRRAEAAA